MEGQTNTYGHPHEEVLTRMSTEEIPYWITYEEGAINWITDILRPMSQSVR